MGSRSQRRLLVLACLLLVPVGCLPEAEAAPGRAAGDVCQAVRLFDAHSHLLGPADAEMLVSRLFAEGIEGVLLMPEGPPRRVKELADRFGGYVHPSAQLARDDEGVVVLDERAVRRVEQALRSGARAIGELSLRHRPFPHSPAEGDMHAVNGEIPLELYSLAARYDVPVIVHVEYELDGVSYTGELEDALDFLETEARRAGSQNAVMIWAHAGDAVPEQIRPLLAAHPDLYIDISTRNDFYRRGIPLEIQSIMKDGYLKEDWKQLFLAHPERVLFGLDLGGRRRLDQLGQVVRFYRCALTDIGDPEIAERIGSGNVRRLLGIE